MREVRRTKVEITDAAYSEPVTMDGQSIVGFEFPNEWTGTALKFMDAETFVLVDQSGAEIEVTAGSNKRVVLTPSVLPCQAVIRFYSNATETATLVVLSVDL